ncbi:hypothetical protein [Sodalis sp. RH16]|uniref:hypothetical protein n=1 Tax=Sodalis sp. RH16 TaxID=3394331 RepID=UPI0039B43443
MPNIITLTATPNQYSRTLTPPPNIALEALVVDAVTGAPQGGVVVTFESPTPLLEFEPAPVPPGSPVTATTDPATGIATVSITLSAAIGALVGVIKVTATIPDDSATVTVPVYDPNKAPLYVTNAEDGIIDQYDINSGIQTTIPLQPGIAAGSLVTFYWGRVQRSRIIDVSDTGVILGLPWVINLKTNFPTASVLTDGRYLTFYTVTEDPSSPTSNAGSSTPRTITVQGSAISPATLLAPLLLPASLNNKINALAAAIGVQIRIPPQPAISAGSGTYSIFLVATPQGPGATGPISRTLALDQPVPTPIPADGITFNVPAATLAGIDDSIGDVYYVYSPATGPASTSRHLGILVDTVGPFVEVDDEDDHHHHGGHGHGHGHDHRPGWDRDDK